MAPTGTQSDPVQAKIAEALRGQGYEPGEIVMQMRLDRGWGRAELARRANVKPKTIRFLEVFPHHLPLVETQLGVTRALGLKITDVWPLPVQVEHDVRDSERRRKVASR